MDEVDEVVGSTVQAASMRNSLLSDDSFSTSDSKTLQALGDLITTDLDPESRSLSIDSAYGTLSPQSLITELDLKGSICQSEGEETDTGEEEEEAFEDEDNEDDDDGDDSITWNGSQITVNESYILDTNSEELNRRNDFSGRTQVVAGCRSQTLRRRSPVQPRPDYLQHFTLRSRSEDDLLQCLTGPLLLRSTGKKNVSKSLTHLTKQTSHSDEVFQTDEDKLHEDPKTLSSKLSNTLRRAEARQVQRTLSCPNGQADCEGSDAETVAPSGLEEKQDLVVIQETHQQHKKLTVAQLHKIRATMVLNSTLTAS